MFFPKNGVDVLKELFTSCAGLNFGRVVGLLALFTRFVIFCLMEL